MRRGVAAAIVSVSLAIILAGGGSARAEVPVLVLDGRGNGHGVGMSQWGAKYLAEAGATVDQILGTFYPGTQAARAGGLVRIGVHQAPAGSALLRLPSGGEVRSAREGEQAPGFPIVVAPGGSIVVRYEANTYRVDGAVQARGTSQAQCLPALGPCPTTTTTAPPTTTTAAPAPVATAPAAPPADPSPGPAPAPGDTTPPPAATTTAEPVSSTPLWVVPAGGGVVDVADRGRTYRGAIEAVGGDGLRLVNEVDVETYLKGMAEVPPTWPAAAQQAQAIAARTWVLRAMGAGGEVCDTERCQVYVGASREAPGQSAAVDATSGIVLTYGGALAATVYSADAGGVAATTEEGFGTPDGVYPYLTTVRYDTPDPRPWRVDIALGDIAGRFGYPGDVSGVRVTRSGPSGRALEVTIDGTAGPIAVDGRAFASKLGLPSTLFTPTIGAAAAVPAAPVADPALTEQALPDAAPAIAPAAVGPPVPAVADAVPAGRPGTARWPALLAAAAIAADGALLRSRVSPRLRGARPWRRGGPRPGLRRPRLPVPSPGG